MTSPANSTKYVRKKNANLITNKNDKSPVSIIERKGARTQITNTDIKNEDFSSF